MLTISPSFELIDPPLYEELLEKVERAGRVCYKSESKISEGSAEKFISSLLSRGHESVIEHAIISVKITCDRGVTHELVRHRIASYSQESTRYCNYSKNKYGNQITCIDISTGFKYDLTNEVDLQKYNIWIEAMNNAENSYFALLNLGASPQEARSVLPNSLKTDIVTTMNIRSWRNFFKLRTSAAAHPQMREIASMLLNDFVNRYPVFFSDLQ